MFKQLYWRITGWVMLAVFLAVLATGSMGLVYVLNLCKADFSAATAVIEESELPALLGDILTAEQEDSVKLPQAEAAIAAYSGQLGLHADRNFFVLSARDASVILPASLRPGKISLTENLSAAMRGAKGNAVRVTDDMLDYALFIPNGDATEDGLILYLRDHKVGFNQTMRNATQQMLWAMLIGLLLAAILGIFITRAMAAPLRQLSRRVERFAAGDFSPSLEKPQPGELGSLLRSFNRIGTVMNDSLSQIRTEKHKIEVILEHINSGIIAFDTEQRVLHINSAAKKMFRIDQPDALRFDSFFRALNSDICMAEFMYLDRFRTEEQDLLVGEDHFKAYLVPFKMDNVRIAGVVCVFEDVTKQFNLEAARQKFVAEVSHELKTPLATIRMYTETLLNGYLDDKKMATNLLTTVESETDKMTALVKNLLLLNQFDMQGMDIHKEFFSLDDLLRGVVDIFRLEAEQKGLSLTYNRTTELSDIFADRDQIERAVKNIVSNSIRYCAKGDKVQIFAGNLYNNIYIKVEDTGKGIPKEDLEHVFERFYRVDKARSREKGGTGLGLSITKEIIESHGGTIQIESEFGRFTRVTINLPADIPEQ